MAVALVVSTTDPFMSTTGFASCSTAANDGRQPRGSKPGISALVIDHSLFSKMLDEEAIVYPLFRSEAVMYDVIANMPHSMFERVSIVAPKLWPGRIERIERAVEP